MGLKRILSFSIVCLFAIGYIACGKSEKVIEDDKGEVVINITSEDTNKSEKTNEENAEKNNSTNKEVGLEKEKQKDEKTTNESTLVKDEIISYKTYKSCERFSYGVDEEIITGKKSEILDPSFILSKIFKNGFGVPAGTKVNSFKVNANNIGYLDLTEQMNTVVGGSGYEEQRNAAMANTFISAYGIDGLVININGGCFDGGSHKSYGINESLKTSLLIHDPTHNLEKYKEAVKKYTGDTVLVEVPSDVHSQAEIDKARKVLEDKYKTDFLYLDETCGNPEMFGPFNNEFISFLRNSGGDIAYSIKRGTNEIYLLLQPPEMVTIEEFKRRYPHSKID